MKTGYKIALGVSIPAVAIAALAISGYILAQDNCRNTMMRECLTAFGGTLSYEECKPKVAAMCDFIIMPTEDNRQTAEKAFWEGLGRP